MKTKAKESERKCPICEKPESELCMKLMCGSCGVDLFGAWTIEDFKDEEWQMVEPDDWKPVIADDLFGKRVFPMVALPMSLTLADIESVRNYAKNWTQGWAYFRVNDTTSYAVMQFRVKEIYTKQFARDVKLHGGKFLVKKK